MALTALMLVVIIISYALMFALVKFTENVIATNQDVGRRDINKAP